VTPNRFALGLSIIAWGILAGLFMSHMEWMRPHMGLVLGEYGDRIAAYLAAAGVCLYAGIYRVARSLGIGDLGRKMDILEVGLRSDSPHDAALARALERQRSGEGL